MRPNGAFIQVDVFRCGWHRTRLDSIEGAWFWTGQAVLAHNLMKIGALAG